MLGTGLRYSGWLKGWGLIEGHRPGWKFAGAVETRQTAQTAAADAGCGYRVRRGSYDGRTKDFVSGNSR